MADEPVTDASPIGNPDGEQRIYVPRELQRTFAEIARKRMHRQKALVHAWVVNAAQKADRGRGDELPAIRSYPSDRARGGVKVPWTQHPDEYSRCYRLIRDSGSSIAVVIRAGMTDYNDHDGDVFSLDFLAPRRR